jgi:hypothetical protein
MSVPLSVRMLRLGSTAPPYLPPLEAHNRNVFPHNTTAAYKLLSIKVVIIIIDVSAANAICKETYFNNNYKITFTDIT